MKGIPMKASTLILLTALVFNGGCDDDPQADADADVDADADGDGDGDIDGDADEDSGPPPTCADTTTRVAMPTPAWQVGGEFTPPEGDRAADILRRRRVSWFERLDDIDGWASRPTIIIPLSGTADAVDGAAFRAFGKTSPESSPELLDTTFTASLVDDGQAVLVRPDFPFPAGIGEAIVVLSTGAVSGADPLPACGADGEADPAYAEAAASLPDMNDVALALPFVLSTVSEELPQIWTQYSSEPVLVVSSLEAHALESYGEAAPPPEVATLLASDAAQGILDLPDYRGPEGSFVTGVDGHPEPQGTTSPGIVIALPSTGDPPYPFVLFQHGGTQNKLDVFQLAGPLAEAGFALVAIDLPFHGDRSGGGGGSDMDIIDFNDPLKARDNLRQASADHLALLSGIAALNAAIEPALGVSDALDADRSFYMGLSLGGITGSLTYASAQGERSIRSGALFVAAADYTQIVTFGLFSALVLDVLDRPEIEAGVVLGFLEAMLHGADPLAYAQRHEARDVAPRPLVLMQAVDDPVILMASSDYWGLTFGADLARPFHHAVDGMEELDLPASDNFTWQAGGDSATRILVQAPMDEIPVVERHGALIVQPYSQQLVAHCFRTFLDDGSCEVIDTGFGEH